MIIGNQEFNTENKTYIMGILNVTPDSFSDGGQFNNIAEALRHVEQMVSEGADIIDVGGESTRPNYIPVSKQEEINRVVPVIKEIKKHFNIPISIDTYKSEVAAAALDAGADLINDIWGLKADNKMAQVIKQYDTAVCIMHNRKETVYREDFISSVKSDIQESIDIALEAGIDRNKIMIDPGIGFAKTYEMNLLLLNRLEELRQFEFPVLLGTSRKSVIGLTLKEPVQNRLEGTIATSVIGVMKGCSFLRVHDVLANLRAVKMTEAIIREVSDGSDKNNEFRSVLSSRCL